MPDTGYEPNVRELTGTTELNDAIFSDFIDFQDSLAHTAPSSDLYMATTTTSASLLAEVHRDCADYRLAEGVNVSQSSVSVMVDRTGELVERSDSDYFLCSVRNEKSAQNQFLVITQTERMVDRTVKPVEERITEERESSSAQIRTLFNEQRKTIIAAYCEKVSHHELLAAQAEQDRRILQEELLRQQQDFREVHQQDFIKMKCRSTALYSSCPRNRSTSSSVCKAGALVFPSSCLDGEPHGWVPIYTHSTPVPSLTGEAVGGLRSSRAQSTAGRCATRTW